MPTFNDMYDDACNELTPGQRFVRECAQTTCRAESTVRQWLSGVQNVPLRAKQQLARHFKSSVEEMFPNDSINDDNN